MMCVSSNDTVAGWFIVGLSYVYWKQKVSDWRWYTTSKWGGKHVPIQVISFLKKEEFAGYIRNNRYARLLIHHSICEFKMDN